VEQSKNSLRRQRMVAVRISGETMAVVAASGGTAAGLLIAESYKKKKCVSALNNKKCKCKKDNQGNKDCEEDWQNP